ncbi:MAG: hypothetical protein ABIK28_25685 [Planctomycetota bacterium]
MKSTVLVMMMVCALTIPAIGHSAEYLLVGPKQVQYKDAVSGVSAIEVPSGTCEAFIEVEGGAIRYFYDGSDPDGGTGYILSNGDRISMKTPYQCDGFRWTLKAGESGATLYVTPEKKR